MMKSCRKTHFLVVCREKFDSRRLCDERRENETRVKVTKLDEKSCSVGEGGMGRVLCVEKRKKMRKNMVSWLELNNI